MCHERSRVFYLADLGNRPIYPTQFYSILFAGAFGIVVAFAMGVESKKRFSRLA
ncbi:MAG: hypothetical protein GY749_08690 [Desulfobacteraceae bacterium]|nr:hypothetical protein [Desulfobacteraceae bacterium]